MKFIDKLSMRSSVVLKRFEELQATLRTYHAAPRTVNIVPSTLPPRRETPTLRIVR